MHLAALVLATVSWSGHTLSQSPNVPEDLTCALIAQSISSSSSVYYPGNPLLGLLGLSESSVAYEKGIYHWAFSSTQRAKCVVEPGTPADVATIVGVFRGLGLSQPSNSFQCCVHQLQILGSTRTPFAVRYKPTFPAQRSLISECSLSPRSKEVVTQVIRVFPQLLASI